MKYCPKKERVTIGDSIFLVPYQYGFEFDFFNLVQKNMDRLKDSFPNMVRKNETVDGTKGYFEEKNTFWNKNIEYANLIFFEELLIGHFNIKDINIKKSTVELSYFIDKDFEKRGIVFQIIENRKKFIFNQLNIKTIKARCNINNKESEKVMQRAGMQYEGTIYQNYKTYDEMPVDTYIYSITQ